MIEMFNSKITLEISFVVISQLWFAKISSSFINGGWSVWDAWSSECSEHCGEGFRTRWRYCDTPTASSGGSQCLGSNIDKAPCNLQHCSGLELAPRGESCTLHCFNKGMLCSPFLDMCGSISSIISNCSGTSSPSYRYRYEPSLNTLDNSCHGYKDIPREISCHEIPPPTHQRVCRCYHQGDDVFREWSYWGECSQSCDRGIQFRTRICVNASNCQGIFAQDRYCNEMKCPIHGQPNQWSSWSSCTVSCGGGQQSRQRTCNNPTPKYDGKPCYNQLLETALCNVEPCPYNGTFSQWSQWSVCPECNDHNQLRYTIRYRTCHNPMYGGSPCVGDTFERRICGDSSIVTETCPYSVIIFSGILRGIAWKNQFYYPKSPDYSNTEQKIKLEIFRMYEDFHTNISSGLSSIFMTSITPAPNGVNVIMEIGFQSLSNHQYLFMQECLQHFSSIGKLSVEPGYSLTINESYVIETAQWGNVPYEAANITSIMPLNSTSVRIHWLQINQSNFMYNNIQMRGGYTIFYRRNLMETVFLQCSVSSLENDVIIGNLSPASEYIFYVVAYNMWGHGMVSLDAVARTHSALPLLPTRVLQIEIFEAINAELFVFWDKTPVENMNGVLPLYYNIYVTNIKTSDVTVKKIPYLSLCNSTLDLIPSTLYEIRICTENEIGESAHCLYKLWRTHPKEPLWNSFNIMVLSRTDTNRVALSWTPIPFSEQRSDLVSYEIEYTQDKYNGHNIEQPIRRFKSLHPSQLRYEFLDLSLVSLYQFRMKAVTMSGDGPWSTSVYASTCSCPVKLTTNYVQQEPYIYKSADGRLIGVLKDALEYVFMKTCGVCSINGTDQHTQLEWSYKGTGQCQEKSTLNDVRNSIGGTIHVSAPFFEHPGNVDIYDGKFLPVVQHPGTSFIHMSPDESAAVQKQMNQLLAIIPFVLILSLFVVIIGILAWVFERKNPQFNDRFTRGIFQGMYMAYVTMTTVGYGDKYATTRLGRLFMIFWFMTSLVLSSIFVGNITSVITSASLHSNDIDVKSGTIGAISSSEDFKKGLRLGARMNEDENHHNVRDYTTLEQLSHDLENRKIKGVLVDSYLVSKYPEHFSKPDMLIKTLYQHRKWYGVILRGSITNSHDALHHTVTDNDLPISLIYSRYKNDLKITNTIHIPSLADEHAPQMKSALIYTSVICIILALIGALVWYCGIRRWKRKQLSKVTRRKRKFIRESCRECTQFIEKWTTDIAKRMEALEEKQTKERIDVWRNMKPGAVIGVRPSNYNISTMKLNSAFITQ